MATPQGKEGPRPVFPLPVCPRDQPQKYQCRSARHVCLSMRVTQLATSQALLFPIKHVSYWSCHIWSGGSQFSRGFFFSRRNLPFLPRFHTSSVPCPGLVFPLRLYFTPRAEDSSLLRIQLLLYRPPGLPGREYFRTTVFFPANFVTLLAVT